MNRRLVVVVLLSLAGAACSEDPAAPGPQNEAPEAVSLFTPADGETDLEGPPQLTWSDAVDPEGKPTTYTVKMDDRPTPTTLVAEGLESPQLTVTSPLERGTTYYWSVTAIDDQSAATESVVFQFTTRGNRAPEAFALLGVPNGATGVDGSPELVWEPAIDPEGDPVTYDLYLDENSSPSTLIAGDLTTTAHQVDENMLGIETQYSWRVIAKDDRGAQTQSLTHRFTTQPLVYSEAITTNAAFDARAAHSSAEFDGKMWVIGGRTCCGGRFEDVWWSDDGETWNLATDSPGFGPRAFHATVVFNGRLWVIGGASSYAAGSEYADVWSSVDGVTWQQETAEAAFGPRVGHEAVVFDGKIWVIGGRDVARSYSSRQVWSSSDGISWTMETDDGNFGGSGAFRVTQFQGALYKTGGLDDRVYRSPDGITWTVVNETAAFGERYNQTVVVFDDRMWLISGSNDDQILIELPDVWFTDDGVTWQRAAHDAGFEPVAGHASLVFDDRMWIIAGGGGWQSFWVTSAVYALN